MGDWDPHGNNWQDRDQQSCLGLLEDKNVGTLIRMQGCVVDLGITDQ